MTHVRFHNYESYKQLCEIVTVIQGTLVNEKVLDFILKNRV